METFIYTAVPIVMSALAFVAYNHPAIFRTKIGPWFAGACFLTGVALTGFFFGVQQVELLLVEQDLHTATSLTLKQYKTISGKIGELRPPMLWLIALYGLFFYTTLLDALPHLGITRDSRDSKT